jgi:uncharacterized protein YjbI with pentapeptide repeats
LASGYLVGPGAILIGANLTGVDLTGVDLTNSNLTDADLTGATMPTGEVMGGIGGQNSKLKLPKNWTVHNGLLIGPGVKLTGANLNSVNLSQMDLSSWDFTKSDLQYANLSDANLMKANLEGAKLENAILSGVRSGNIKGKPASLPAGWRLVEGHLVGAKANLGNANLKDAQLLRLSLAGANLTGANLTGANLTGANLTGANLTGANLTGANLTDAKLDKCVCRDLIGNPVALPDGWSKGGNEIGRSLKESSTPEVKGDYREGNTLTVTAGQWDTGVAFRYQWLRGDLPIPGATQATYVLTESDVGNLVSVMVTGSKTGFAPVDKISNAGKVNPRALILTPKPSIWGTPRVGETIFAREGIWDVGVRFSYQWFVDGSPLMGKTSSSYTVPAEHFGKAISVKVTGSLASYPDVAQNSDPVQISAGQFTWSTPKLSGTAKTGSTLKSLTSAWGKGAKITYKWLSNGAVIKGATGSSLKLTASMKGKKIAVVVTQTAAGYTTLSKTSAALLVK